MLTEDNSKKGKAIEHYIISELLKYDFDVFVPIVDNGTDIIIKTNDKAYIEIQVKSRVIKDDDDVFFIKDYEPCYNFFIVCHDITSGDFWVCPSSLFKKHAEEKESNGKKKLFMSFKTLKYRFQSIHKTYQTKPDKFVGYENELGLQLLKKAVEQDENKVK